ncbi:MAG: hypothetical protein K2X93_18180 [Candidatus Obscuribacterales bacterium]|nr:hypothetical protein [Candidatus Obscuribacterales bacterium]
MKPVSFLFQFLFIIFAWGVVCESPAEAYLDPSTGAFLFHCISAAILGALITLRLWWTRLLMFFKAKPKAESNPPVTNE